MWPSKPLMGSFALCSQLKGSACPQKTRSTRPSAGDDSPGERLSKTQWSMSESWPPSQSLWRLIFLQPMHRITKRPPLQLPNRQLSASTCLGHQPARHGHALVLLSSKVRLVCVATQKHRPCTARAPPPPGIVGHLKGSPAHRTGKLEDHSAHGSTVRDREFTHSAVHQSLAHQPTSPTRTPSSR